MQHNPSNAWQQLEDEIRADVEARHGLFLPGLEVSLLLTDDLQAEMEELADLDYCEVKA